MNDLISRKALIEKVRLQRQDALHGAEVTGRTIFKQKAMDCKNFIDLIDSEPSVTDTNVGGKWIPIGQYPTEPCLLCFENGSMAVGYYDESEDVCICAGVYDYCILEDPIAYTPLPEPYKGE